MTGRELIQALGGRWHGSYGTARCPAHEDKNPSLSVSERDGKVLLKCHADCDQEAVIDALRERGLWDDHVARRPHLTTRRSTSSAPEPNPNGEDFGNHGFIALDPVGARSNQGEYKRL